MERGWGGALVGRGVGVEFGVGERAMGGCRKGRWREMKKLVCQLIFTRVVQHLLMKKTRTLFSLMTTLALILRVGRMNR